MYNQDESIYTKDTYNEFAKSGVYQDFYEEADYVLTQGAGTDHNGTYTLAKKPSTEVRTTTGDVWGFLNTLEASGNNLKVLVIHIDRTFNIYNLNVSANLK
jgi:hypothetical protein